MRSVSFMFRQGQRQMPAMRSRRVTAACVLVLFGIQFSRYFLVIPLDQFLCLEAMSASPAGPPVSYHHHSDEVSQGAAQSNDNGYSIEHCKDTLMGMALTPVQPFGVPEAATALGTQTAWTLQPPSPLNVFEQFPVTPFQPPRA